MKGIVLAGGNGTRLHPITYGVSKQLLPIFDKPLIYYPLSVLFLARITEILIITSPEDAPQFHRLLGDGSQFGVGFQYVVQEEPNGLAEAFLLGESFIGDDDVCLVLGDNIFYGYGFTSTLRDAVKSLDGCVLFGYEVSSPELYGVGEKDSAGRLVSIEEKPVHPRSNLAITGLYMYDNQVVRRSRELVRSERGELEITDLNMSYLRDERAHLIDLGRGFAWLDTGNQDAMLSAASFVQVLEHRQGIRMACLEEIALREKFISPEQCLHLGLQMYKSAYGRYVIELAEAAGARMAVDEPG